VKLCDRGLQHSEEAHWQAWQVHVMQFMAPLLAALKCVGIAPPEAVTGDLAVTATATTTTTTTSSSSAGGGDPVAAGGGSSSAASSQHVKWGCLLQLPQINPQWAAALTAYEAKQPG
jgi:hypothetical protein